MTRELDFSDMYQITVEEATARYNAAAHAMQSGVAMTMNDPAENETSPKHLRVGVNSAMVDAAALAGLLIHKRLITSHEYLCAIMKGMEREKALYESRLTKKLATSIKLG